VAVPLFSKSLSYFCAFFTFSFAATNFVELPQVLYITKLSYFSCFVVFFMAFVRSVIVFLIEEAAVEPIFPKA
jgi:hypothetical protein